MKLIGRLYLGAKMVRVPAIPLELIYRVRDKVNKDDPSIRERMFLTRYSIVLEIEREAGRER